MEPEAVHETWGRRVQEPYVLDQAVQKVTQQQREFVRAERWPRIASLSRCRRWPRRDRSGRSVSRLLGNAQQPLFAESACDFLMRHGATRFRIRQPLVDLVEDIQVVLHVLQSTVVREPVQKVANSSFCIHIRNIAPVHPPRQGIHGLARPSRAELHRRATNTGCTQATLPLESVTFART